MNLQSKDVSMDQIRNNKEVRMMPICQNCQTEWSWKQTIKKSFTMDTAMNCSNCNHKQYPTRKTRRRFALYLLIPLLSLLLPSFGVSGLIVIGILISGCILLMAMYPFILQLSSQEEWP